MRPLLWNVHPDSLAALSIPVGLGGELVVCSLDLLGHLDQRQPTWDPVAERVLINLLVGEMPSPEPAR